MILIRIFSIASVICLSLIGCAQSSKGKQIEEQAENVTHEITESTSPYLGTYVTEGYFLQEEGYDWLAVSVKATDGDSVHVFINSRDDIKTPTCTFEAVCQKVNDFSYKAVVENKNILFSFSKENVQISTENVEDEKILYFYCSGGATLKGSYVKLED